MTFLLPVSYVVWTEDPNIVPAIGDSRARIDDAFWEHFANQPLTPQRYLNWWIARRWVVPRDVRRRLP